MHEKDVADFLRRRREALRPADVGLPPGPRRRTSGLRREEVAALAGMSTDYYARLEQRRGPQPSVPMSTALARALLLTPDERDYLFGLLGHHPPARFERTEHVSPTLLRLLGLLGDSPALVISDLAEVLAQNASSMALTRDQVGHRGLARSAYYRWFTDPVERSSYPEEDHLELGRTHVARLRAAVAVGSDTRGAAAIVEALTARSPEFVALWERQEVLQQYDDRKAFMHPELGRIEVDCEFLVAENRAQTLVVMSAPPGSDSQRKLQLLTRDVTSAAP